MDVKAIIFDVDGTLLKTYEDLADAVNYGLAKCGFPTHDAEKFKIFAGNGTEKMIERSLPDGEKTRENIEKLIPLYLEYYNAHTGEKTRVYDGVKELVEALKKKGYKLGVVSNKIDCMTQRVIKEYFGDLFDSVTGQTDGMPTKPDPAMVFATMEKLNVTPKECIFVGDSGVDALTGKNSGAFMVGVLWGFRDEKELRENGAEVIIKKPAELLEFLD